MKYFSHVSSPTEAETALRGYLGQLHYFGSCSDREGAKKLRMKLSKENHPDVGGNNDKLAEINAEFDTFTDVMDQYDELKEAMRRYPNLFRDEVAPERVPLIKKTASEFYHHLKGEIRKPENRKNIEAAAEILGGVVLKTLATSLLKKADPPA